MQSPFIDYSSKTLCSIPHYLQTPETERINLNFPSSISQRNEKSLSISISNLDSNPEINKIEENKLSLKSPVYFCLTLPEKYSFIASAMNGLLGISEFIDKISTEKKGDFRGIVDNMIKMIYQNKYSLMHSTKLIQFLEDNYKNIDDNYFSYIFNKLDEEVNKILFTKLARIKIYSITSCRNCNTEEKQKSYKIYLEIEPLKSINEAISYYTENIKISEVCKNCNNQLNIKNEISSLSNILIFSIARFRKIPYLHKISAFTRYPKKLNVCNKEYFLYAVITHEGSIDDGKYCCYCKRGKSWHLCTDSGLSKISLVDVLKQIACILIYYII